MTALRDRLTIRRWRSVYRVAITHASPHDVQQKLDDALRRCMPDALARLDPHGITRDTDALYFVRCLALEWHADAAVDSDELARQGAKALGTALARTLAEGENGNVIRFRHRTDYLARFIGDCALGEAWQRWYYAPFEGLRHLSSSAAIRDALTEDPALGLDALLALSETARRRVLTALSAHDALVLLRGWMTPASDASLCFAQTLQAGIRCPYPFHSVQGQALWLYLHVSAHGGGTCVPACLAVAALIHILHGLSPAQRTASIAALIGLTPGVSHNYLPWLNELAPEVRRHGIQQLAAAMDMPAPVMLAEGAYTPFGSAFMLLPILDAMLLERVTLDWPNLEVPDASPLSAAQTMRWLLLAQAQGGQRMRAFLADPLWRDLFGVDGRVSLDIVTAWLHSLKRRWLRDWRRCMIKDSLRAQRPAERGFLVRPASPWPGPWRGALVAAAERLMGDFACKLPGFAGSSAGYLYAQVFGMGAHVQYQQDRLVVTLERPPLALLLNLAGLNRGRRDIAWLTTGSLHFFSRE